MRRPCSKNDAPAEHHGIYKLKNSDKATLFSLIEEKVMPAPTSKSLEDQEFVVDSGASMHMMSKKDLNSDELDTLRKSRTPTYCGTYIQWRSSYKRGNMSIRSRSKPIRDCNYSKKRLLFNRMENFAKTTNIPMSGSAVKNHGWPRKTITCKTDNFVPLAVPVLSTTSGSNSSSTSTSQDLSTGPAQERSDGRASVNWCDPSTQNKNKKMDDRRDADDRLRDLPDWLEEFTDNLQTTELPASAHGSQNSDSERPPKVVSKSRKHNIQMQFPQDRNCDVCLRTKMTSLLQKTHWRSSTSCRKVCWLDNGGSQSPQWGMWIQRQSPVRCRCTRSYYSVDSISSVQNKNFSGDGKEFVKILGAVTQTKSHLHWQLIEIWKNMWRFCIESPHFDTSSIRD